MVQYKCITCDKKFDKKHNYEVHINRKFKCKQKPREIILKDDIELFEEKLEEQTIEIDKLNQDNIILKEQNKNLTKLISNMQTEQKALNNRLNALETFIIKNINVNTDFINDELQNGGAIEGLQFENQLSNELKKYNINIYFDKEITKKYGKSCAGVDIVIKKDNKLITLQCKREIKSGSLKDVNHFIRGSQIIEKKENIKPKLYWISKVAPNKSALESLKLDNITIITDINSKNCLKKCIDNIEKDMDLKDEILKK